MQIMAFDYSLAAATSYGVQVPGSRFSKKYPKKYRTNTKKLLKDPLKGPFKETLGDPGCNLYGGLTVLVSWLLDPLWEQGNVLKKM